MDGRWFGRLLSWYPPYWGTGIKVRMASDYSAAEVRMALRFYNRNYFGTHFGGSLYAMVDPMYVLLLANRLGEGYSVWDKAAVIEFVNPGRGLVRADFEVGDDRLAEVRQATANGEKYRPVWPVEIVDRRASGRADSEDSVDPTPLAVTRTTSGRALTEAPVPTQRCRSSASEGPDRAPPPRSQ